MTPFADLTTVGIGETTPWDSFDVGVVVLLVEEESLDMRPWFNPVECGIASIHPRRSVRIKCIDRSAIEGVWQAMIADHYLQL